MKIIKKNLFIIIILLFFGSGLEIYGAWNEDYELENTVDNASMKIENTTITKGEESLGENPYYLVHSYVDEVNVPVEVSSTYELGVVVHIYEDEACQKEIGEGVHIEIMKQTKIQKGQYEILARIEVQDTKLAGKELHVRVQATLEKA